jgi:hypothetical protein
MANIINAHTILLLTTLKVEVSQTKGGNPTKKYTTHITRAERTLGHGLSQCIIHFNCIFIEPVTLRPSEVARLLNEQPISLTTEYAEDNVQQFSRQIIIKPIP